VAATACSAATAGDVVDDEDVIAEAGADALAAPGIDTLAACRRCCTSKPRFLSLTEVTDVTRRARPIRPPPVAGDKGW